MGQSIAEKFANNLLHGALGCAIGAAKANSSEGCAGGAIGGSVGHFAAEQLEGFGLTGSEVQELSKLAVLVTSIIADQNIQNINIALGTAQNAVANNRQLHPNEAQLIRANAERYAESKNITLEKALADLTQQALRNVDSAHDTPLGADNKDAQDFLNTLGQGQTYVDKLTGQTFQLFAADEATRNNHAMFGQYTKTPAVENLLDQAYAAVTLPKDAQTIQGLNGSFKGSLTGSDLALNDAARDTSNMWKQPPVVQWAVLGHLRQERSENMQGQIDLMDELRKLNASGDHSLEARNRKLQIINDLTNLENENQVMLKASQLHILGMGQNGLLSPINQRETFEGFGAARSSGGVNFRGMSSASINARIAELKFAKTAAAAEAKAIEQARIGNNFLRDDFQQFDQFRNPNSTRAGGEWDWNRVAPNNGAVIGTERKINLSVGTKLDRYGNEYGTFLSPAGTPYPERALAPGSRADGYHQYTVQKPFIVESAKVAPAVGQAGGGTQYRIVTPAGGTARVNVDYLIKNGYLK